jgi:subtilisin
MINRAYSQSSSRPKLGDLDELFTSTPERYPIAGHAEGIAKRGDVSLGKSAERSSSTQINATQVDTSGQQHRVSYRQSDIDELTGLETASALVGRSKRTRAGGRRRMRATSLYSAQSGYGLVDAGSAVGAVTGQTLARASDLGGVNWGLDQVNAVDAWARGYTGQSVVVAVVDTGVDYRHTDLDANLWRNSDEIFGNRVDDDNNGFIDDVLGWDFVGGDNNPYDWNGHGTHVAGTIAAENNGFGITGVAPNAKIMPVRVLDASGAGSLSTVAEGVRYAADNGADVINLSLGGEYPSRDVNAAVQYAEARGSVVVMAAGNTGGRVPGSPARLAQQQGIAVGAVNRSRQMPSFSNRAGRTPLKYVVAPGVDVTSTVPNNSYASYSGTSMATPYVSGAAALTLSANPSLAPNQVEAVLTGTASPGSVIA